ncbi:MAG: flagellar hook-length control protein FliK [Pseudomonadota bacterium]
MMNAGISMDLAAAPCAVAGSAPAAAPEAGAASFGELMAALPSEPVASGTAPTVQNAPIPRPVLAARTLAGLQPLPLEAATGEITLPLATDTAAPSRHEELLKAAPSGPDAGGAALAAPEQFLKWLDTIKVFAPAADAGGGGRSEAPVALAAPTAALALMVASDALPVAAEAAAETPPGLAPVSAAFSSLLAAPTTAAVSNTPTVPTPSTMLAMDQPEWPERLGEVIQWRLGEGLKEARIEIHPRELGAVDIRLSMDERGLSVQLNAAQASTRDLLQQELPRLRESLQQGGVLLADAQVGREGAGQQQSPARTSQGSFGQRARDADEAAEAAPVTTAWRLRRGLLDDYA